MNFTKPKSEDWEKYVENIAVWIGTKNICKVDDTKKCSDIQLTGKQKEIGNCGDCDYFMGYRSKDFQRDNLPACCWALKQLK
jgi:hypothetical protein